MSIRNHQFQSLGDISIRYIENNTCTCYSLKIFSESMEIMICIVYILIKVHVHVFG